MNLREVETLVDLVHVARVSEVTIRAQGRRITVRKDPSAAPTAKAPVEIVRAPVQAAVPAQETAGAVAEEPEVEITAPMVGIFHAAERPVEVGMRVESGQVVGAIESMRLMNDVRAEVSGTVEAILVEDGMAVEYGQPIFRLGSGETPANETGETA